jgi:hypothetical protein
LHPAPGRLGGAGRIAGAACCRRTDPRRTLCCAAVNAALESDRHDIRAGACHRMGDATDGPRRTGSQLDERRRGAVAPARLPALTGLSR